jgi:hypothetical protein
VEECVVIERSTGEGRPTKRCDIEDRVSSGDIVVVVLVVVGVVVVPGALRDEFEPLGCCRVLQPGGR